MKDGVGPDSKTIVTTSMLWTAGTKILGGDQNPIFVVKAVEYLDDPTRIDFRP